MFAREVPASARRALLRRFAQTLDQLTHRGMRFVFHFPEAIRAQQTAWPENCPLSETELRREVQALRDAGATLEQRGRELYARLPEPPRAELVEFRPLTLYEEFHGALGHFADVGLKWCLEGLERALSETPQSLRAVWLEFELKQCLDVLGDSATKTLVPRLVRELCRQDGEEGDRISESGALKVLAAAGQRYLGRRRESGPGGSGGSSGSA